MNRNDQKNFASLLFQDRRHPGDFLPVKHEATKFADDILGILFPHFSKKIYYSEKEIEAEIILLHAFLEKILKPLCETKNKKVEEIVDSFFAKVPSIHESLMMDAKSIDEGDPASVSIDEVILTYPGFIAIAIFRIAHEIYSSGVPLFPRLLTEYAHQLTGIDIHPGAKIGKSFFIDHGTGIVVGETTEIGDNVKIYQGVTLGALSVDKKFTHQKRHPTIEDNVVIYSGATILGGETVVGRNSIIGGNVWLTESVPPHSVVYHKSEVRVRNSKKVFDEPINFVI
jgi:serine O-acetyltransferase